MNLRIILALILVITITGCVGTHREFDYGVKYNALVIKVVDGDTIDVLINGEVKRIRLLGIDTPEIYPKKNKPYEYDSINNLSCLAEWGLKAKHFAYKTLHNKVVYIEFDETAGLKGYYGRYLAYVYLKNDTDFNEMLIKNGFARVYKEGEFKKKREYILIERWAMANGKGLWGACI